MTETAPLLLPHQPAAHLGFLIGPILQLGSALINPAIWMECLNQKHITQTFVWYA